MKKIKLAFLAVLLISFFTQSAYAQQKFSVGLQGGLGMASTYYMYGQGHDSTDETAVRAPQSYLIFSYMSNVYLSYRFHQNYGVAIEPGIIRKGYGQKYLSASNATLTKYHLNYLQLPVLMEFDIDSKLTLTVGPEFGYLMSARMKSDDDEGTITLLPLNDIKRFDIGVQVGGHYSLAEHFDLGLKIGNSFTSIEETYFNHAPKGGSVVILRKKIYINLFTRIKL